MLTRPEEEASGIKEKEVLIPKGIQTPILDPRERNRLSKGETSKHAFVW